MKLKSKLVLNVGGMFSGKSTELQRQGERHELRGHSVLYVKPSMDNRYSENEIVTHNGNKVHAVSVDTQKPDELLFITRIMQTQVICIDEIQFFDLNMIEAIDGLLKLGKRIYCSGLDLDFEGKPFEITALLMAKSDEVNKLHAVCDNCGHDAWVTPRKTGEKEQVKLGEKENYYPLCRTCFYEEQYQGFWGFEKE
ncbi:thymidine kinase [Priestia megaterium]|uniref:thymidine kinase n=1 Tax=Priestia megaterium TaxID=1404 RepID=UPI000BF9BF7C|nr:thymidine kinase [Priestia megaterium]PFW43824.1 thymidine kinase [Priestia megaterium]